MAKLLTLQSTDFRKQLENQQLINKLHDGDADPHLVRIPFESDEFCVVQTWPRRELMQSGHVAEELYPGKYHLQHLEMAVWFKPRFGLKFEFLSLGKYATSFQIGSKKGWLKIADSTFGMQRWYSRCGFEYEMRAASRRRDSYNAMHDIIWRRSFELLLSEDSSGMCVKLLEITVEEQGITHLYFSYSDSSGRKNQVPEAEHIA